MAYARLGKDSDVYILATSGYRIYIDFDVLRKFPELKDEIFPFDQLDKFIDHLEVLIEMGIKVPTYCMERLKKEFADEQKQS